MGECPVNRVSQNNDNFYDLLVKLTDIKGNKAEITIKNIKEEIITAKPEIKNETNNTANLVTGEVTGKISFKEYFYIVIILIIIMAIYMIVTNIKHDKRIKEGK